MDDVNFGSVHKEAEKSPGFLLWRVSMLWRRAVEEALKPLGLTHPQFVILACVGWMTRKGDRVSQRDVGRQAALDPNTTSQVLKGLEEKGLVKRERMDERSKMPVLTKKGAERLEKAMPAVEGVDGEFFKRVKGMGMLECLVKLAK